MPADGVSSFEAVVSDGRVCVVDAAGKKHTWETRHLLRVGSDEPDAKWYLGLNRTIYDADRGGSELRSVSMCFR